VQVPPPYPFWGGGEVSASCDVSESRISNPSSRRESIQRGLGGTTRYIYAVQAGPARARYR
jgi:hypothetical protein